MTAAERQAMALDRDHSGTRTAATDIRDTAAIARPKPGTLDPLIRALDRAVVRSAQAGPDCSTATLRD
jgi:hypothetical protein